MTARKVKRGGARKRSLPQFPDARLIKLVARYVAAEKENNLTAAAHDACGMASVSKKVLAHLSSAANDAELRAMELERQVTAIPAHSLEGAVAKAQAVAAMFSGGAVEAGPNFLERDLVASLVNDLLAIGGAA